MKKNLLLCLLAFILSANFTLLQANDSESDESISESDESIQDEPLNLLEMHEAVVLGVFNALEKSLPHDPRPLLNLWVYGPGHGRYLQQYLKSVPILFTSVMYLMAFNAIHEIQKLVRNILVTQSFEQLIQDLEALREIIRENIQYIKENDSQNSDMESSSDEAPAENSELDSSNDNMIDEKMLDEKMLETLYNATTESSNNDDLDSSNDA